MNLDGIQKLARDSQRMIAIDSRQMRAIQYLERLEKSDILKMIEPQFDDTVTVAAEAEISAATVQKLHRRLDDVVMLLAHKQSGHDGADSAIRMVMSDLCRAFGL